MGIIKEFGKRRKVLYLLTLSVIFALEMVLKWATQGFNETPYFELELLLVFLMSCAVAVVPFFFRVMLKGKAGKIVYAVMMLYWALDIVRR